MRVFHATKTQENLTSIQKTKKLTAGSNVVEKDKQYVHLSLSPISPLELLIIGARAEAWILELEIEDHIPLIPDPADRNEGWAEDWIVYEGDSLPVKIIGITHITDLIAWPRAQTRRIL